MYRFEKVSLEQWLKDSGRAECILNEIKLPQRATKSSAGYDFYSPWELNLSAGESIKIATGIKAKIPENSVLLLFPRSSLGFKYFTRLANTIGVVDADYYNNEGNEGHIFIKIRNEGESTLHISAGEAFAQGVIIPYLTMDNDDSSNIRKGGIGSSDKTNE